MSIEKLCNQFRSKEAVIGIIGLGYVGLPLLLRFSQQDFSIIGFDVDQSKVEHINQGKSYIKHISGKDIQKAVDTNVSATTDFTRIKEVDAIIICVPTPLNKHREPDMTCIENTLNTLLPNLRSNQVVSLESTIYPGSTNEYIKPAIEALGLVLGEDVFVVYSPEREDPGNADFDVASIPKLVGGETENCLRVGVSLYEQIIHKVVPVSSTRVAEFAKLLENIHRAVNIGLVNEMKMVADKIGVDIYEVIEAAATKPFGFVPYYPGPGIGGHCIPIDPFYLTWKAREYGLHTRFIELSGEINDAMPIFVVNKLMLALNETGKAVKGANVLLMGISYKPNVDDLRESPALKIIEQLMEKGANIYYCDYNIPRMKKLRNHDLDLQHSELTVDLINAMDASIIVTNNDDVDYDLLLKHGKLIVDTRGVYRGKHENVIRA